MKLPLRVLSRKRQRGTTLVLGLVSLFVVATFATSLLSAVNNEGVGVALQIDRVQALKIGEGVLQVAENDFLDRVSNFQTLQTPTVLNGWKVLSNTYTLGALTGAYDVGRELDMSGVIPTPIGSNVQTDATGLNTLVTPYVLSSVVEVGGAKVTMRRHIELRQTPIFQFLSFFTNDLEILPGPAMTMGGRVHTNENMYLGAGASLTLDTTYVRAAGKLHRRRKDDSSVQSGWIKAKHFTSGALTTLQSKADLASIGVGSTYGLDSDFTGWKVDGDNLFTSPGEMPPFKTQAANQFGGTVGTGEMGVQKLVHPSIGATDPFVAIPGGGGDFVESSPGVYSPVLPGTGTHQKGYYHSNADLVVRDNKVYNKLGLDITLLMPLGFIQTKTMWDARENKTVTLTQLNMNKLKDMDGLALTNDPCPFFPMNGLLYVHRSDSTPATGNGIVLSGGSELNAGLTVVSPNPVYVHGNYNTVNKKAASLITDACHLLSSAWNWTNSSTSGLKVANSTTYNLAIISGNTNTVGSAYSGGFENFPRFHENWTGKNCTIKGSFVCMWNSKIHKGQWVYGGSHYTAPNRIWSYESNFDSPTGLPPFTPTANTTRSVAWEVSQ
jgi:Tfp pilus assembly protein PilX